MGNGKKSNCLFALKKMAHKWAVPKGQRKNIKVIGDCLHNCHICAVSYFVFTCWTLSYYYLDINLVLFLDLMSNILFTDRGALHEELIRIRSPSVIRMLRHLSHLLVGFMLHEFFLFILCETSDVWLDLEMPPRASCSIINHCIM